jgi:hypothetical protein
MRKFVIVVLFTLFAAPAFAQLGRFTGNWHNTNPASGGLIRLVVTAAGPNVSVHAWGKCTPTPCDWGTRPAIVYAPNVGANPIATARAISVVFRTNFDETIVILQPSGANLLTAETYTRFTDTSGRSAYTRSEQFRR